MDENDQPVSKVIQFPNLRFGSPPQTLEEISSKIEEYRTEFADELSELLVNLVLQELSRSGLDLSANEEIIPPIMLLHESIKSVYLKACGIDHPLQEFADEFCDNMGFTSDEFYDTVEE